MKRLDRIAIVGILIGLSLLCRTENADAQLIWRVSVKFILNASGNRPASGNINTDAEVQAQVNVANQILAASGRGYQLSLTEIVDVSGVSVWYNAAINGTTRDLLEGSAQSSPAAYAWRSNAINVYINGNTGSAICSFPPGHEIILMGQGSRSTSMFHEMGHFFDLCHTQGCPCGSCPNDGTLICNTVPGDDEIDDTILDLECWSQNQISQWNYGTTYANLTAAQQDRVNDVFNNIMSYHNNRNRLTEDQLDRMTCASNGVRDHVTNGRTRIVGTQSGDEECLNILYLHANFASALAAANNNDIVLFRGSTYPFTGIVNQDVFLRSSRGNSLVGTGSKAIPPDEEDAVIWHPKLPDTDDGRSGP